MARGKFEYWLTGDGLTLLEGWARDGLTDEQIARNIGITAKTLYEWKRRFGEICEALKKGKEVVDIQVENALLKRALGYSYTETMVEESIDGTKRRETVKFIPPDTTAQIFWLKNRRPEKWRDRPPDGKGAEASTKNNLLSAIMEAGEVDTDDLPEVE